MSESKKTQNAEQPEEVAPCVQRELPGYNFTKDELTDMQFVLKFALDVVEKAALDSLMNKENLVLGPSLEKQISIIDGKL